MKRDMESLIASRFTLHASVFSQQLPHPFRHCFSQFPVLISLEVNAIHIAGNNDLGSVEKRDSRLQGELFVDLAQHFGLLFRAAEIRESSSIPQQSAFRLEAVP